MANPQAQEPKKPSCSDSLSGSRTALCVVSWARVFSYLRGPSCVIPNCVIPNCVIPISANRYWYLGTRNHSRLKSPTSYCCDRCCPVETRCFPNSCLLERLVPCCWPRWPSPRHRSCWELHNFRSHRNRSRRHCSRRVPERCNYSADRMSSRHLRSKAWNSKVATQPCWQAVSTSCPLDLKRLAGWTSLALNSHSSERCAEGVDAAE